MHRNYPKNFERMSSGILRLSKVNKTETSAANDHTDAHSIVDKNNMEDLLEITSLGQGTPV